MRNVCCIQSTYAYHSTSFDLHFVSEVRFQIIAIARFDLHFCLACQATLQAQRKSENFTEKVYMNNDDTTQMADAKPAKAPKQSKFLTLEQKVADYEAKAKAAREELRELQKKEREKNARAILDLLKAESLDEFNVETWKQLLPTIRSSLEKVANSGKV
jgi:hypothetical protein